MFGAKSAGANGGVPLPFGGDNGEPLLGAAKAMTITLYSGSESKLEETEGRGIFIAMPGIHGDGYEAYVGVKHNCFHDDNVKSKHIFAAKINEEAEEEYLFRPVKRTQT